MTEAPTFVAFTPVLAARADEFETWILKTVIANMNEYRPEMAGGARVFRSIDGAVDGTVMFTIFFHGGGLDDWNIKPFLSDAIGAEAADRELARMEEMCPAGQTAYTLTVVPDDVAAAAWADDNTTATGSWPAASPSH